MKHKCFIQSNTLEALIFSFNVSNDLNIILILLFFTQKVNGFLFVFFVLIP